MKKLIIVATIVSTVSCGSKDKDKNDDKPSAPKKQTVCQYKALEEISSEVGSQFPHSLQCKEGYSVDRKRGKDYPVYIDCSTAGTNFDKEKKYLKLFEETCPQDNVIATCKGSTFKIYLYKSDLSTDVSHFTKYCEDSEGSLTQQ